MDTPTLAATRAALARVDARAKRSLAQNFVIDEAVLDAVVAGAGLGPGDGVLEVGPGTGNLTRRLLATGAAVLAVEKDDALADLLRDDLGGEPRFRLVHGDALAVNLPQELARLADAATATRDPAAPPSTPPPRLAVVANLPYNITGDALRLLLPLCPPLSTVLLMLQAEAAERYATSTPSSPAWRGATVLARHYATPRMLLRVPAAAYYPPPRVESAVVAFDLLPPSARLPVADDRVLRAVVAAAFNQRRKALRNSVGGLVGGDGAAVVAAAGLHPDARADAVDVAGFVALANAVCAARGEGGESGGG